MGFYRKIRPRRAASEAAKLPLYHLGGEGPQPQGAYVALVPGAMAPVLPLDLPPGLKGRARVAVARRQMADLFGRSDLDFEMRAVAPKPGKTQWSRALAVDSETRANWLQRLSPACRAVLPDYLALPWGPDIWSIDCTGGQIRARLDVDDGFTAEPALALALLKSALTGTKPRVVLLLGQVDGDIATLLKSHALETATDPAECGAELFAHGELSLDLARDPDAEIQDLRRALRPLVLPLAMAVLALGLWAGAMLLETHELRAQALAQRKGAERILRETMIPTGPILDMRVQVSQLLEKRQAEAAQARMKARPMDVFRKAGRVLGESDAQVLAVSYQAGSGLVMDLKLSDFAALDQVVAALRSAGIELSVAQSTARENEGVEASLALTSNRGAGQ
jgi:general secretion pathway protein L